MDLTTWTSAGLVVTMTVLIGLLRFERDGHSRRSCPPLAAERVEQFITLPSVKIGSRVISFQQGEPRFRRTVGVLGTPGFSVHPRRPRPSLRRVANTGPTCFYDVDRGNCGP